MAKRYSYSFAKKRQSEEGITSTIMAGLSLLLFLIASTVSMLCEGNGGLYLGAIGLIAICVAVYGFGIGLKSFSQEERSYKYSKIGALMNGVIMVGWLALFLTGV